MGINILFIYMLVAFQPLMSRASDDACRQPFVWIKGCHHQPSSTMITKEVRTNKNSPGTCFLECGKLTSLVALHLDQCACLRQGPRLTPVYEYQCDSRCQGDENMGCGSRDTDTPVSWTVYQRASDAELQTMRIQSNATGCGYTLNNGASFGLSSCTSNKAVLCYSRSDNCLNEANPIGVHIWNDGQRECQNENSLFPSSLEILNLLLHKCTTVYSQDIYWIGLYRQTEFSDGCETSTTQPDTKQDTESTSTSLTTVLKDVSMETRLSPEMTTNYREILDNAHTPVDMIFSSHSPIKVSVKEPEQTTGATRSENDITSEILKSPKTLQFQASTKVPTANPLTSTDTANHIVPTGTYTPQKLKLSKTYSRALLKLATKKPLHVLTSLPAVIKKSSKSKSTKSVSNVPSVLTLMTSNPSLTVLSKQSPAYESHLPSTEAASTSEPSLKSEGLEISELKQTVDLSGRAIIALYVVGSCICVLLLLILLILCRISRTLQKQADRKNVSQPTLKRKESQKFTYLTDGAASLPVRGGLLSGRQSPPYPYNGFHQQHSERDTDHMHIRERKGNTYTDLQSSHRNGNTFRTLSEDEFGTSGWQRMNDIGNIV